MEKTFTSDELRDLRRARELLENPSFAIKLSNLLGAPIDAGFALLPKNWSALVNRAAHSALFKALEVAMATSGKKNRGSPSNRWHKILAGASGGVGGAFGLTAMAVELPVSTTLMLRSILQIARDEGHDLEEITIKLACLEVFALGGATRRKQEVEGAYWMTRVALNQSVKEAASVLAGKGAMEKTAPALVRFLGAISSRFGVVISEEVAAKALPVLGAVGGGVINMIFMHHFQQMARGHFIILRLEKIHGMEAVKSQYDFLPSPTPHLLKN